MGFELVCVDADDGSQCIACGFVAYEFDVGLDQGFGYDWPGGG